MDASRARGGHPRARGWILDRGRLSGSGYRFARSECVGCNPKRGGKLLIGVELASPQILKRLLISFQRAGIDPDAPVQALCPSYGHRAMVGPAPEYVVCVASFPRYRSRVEGAFGINARPLMRFGFGRHMDSA